MSGTVRRISLPTALLACTLVIGPVTAARASDATLRSAIKSYNPNLLHDQAQVLNGIATYDRKHSATALIKALNHQVADLHRLQAKLSGQSASTPKGAKAKAEIIRGLGLVAESDSALAKALKDAHGKRVPKSKLQSAVATDKKGNLELAAGGKLLGA